MLLAESLHNIEDFKNALQHPCRTLRLAVAAITLKRFFVLQLRPHGFPFGQIHVLSAATARQVGRSNAKKMPRFYERHFAKASSLFTSSASRKRVSLWMVFVVFFYLVLKTLIRSLIWFIVWLANNGMPRWTSGVAGVGSVYHLL